MATPSTQVCPNCGAPIERSGNETAVTCRFCGTRISFANDTPSMVIETNFPTTTLSPEVTRWIKYFIYFIVGTVVCSLLLAVCATIVPLLFALIGISIPFLVR